MIVVSAGSLGSWKTRWPPQPALPAWPAAASCAIIVAPAPITAVESRKIPVTCGLLTRGPGRQLGRARVSTSAEPCKIRAESFLGRAIMVRECAGVRDQS